MDDTDANAALAAVTKREEESKKYYHEEVAIREQQLRDVESRNTELQREIDRHNEEIKRLKSVDTELRAQVSHAESQVTSTKKSHDMLRESAKEDAKLIKLQKEDVDKEKEKVAEMYQEKRKLQLQLVDERATIEAMHEELDEKEKQLWKYEEALQNNARAKEELEEINDITEKLLADEPGVPLTPGAYMRMQLEAKQGGRLKRDASRSSFGSALDDDEKRRSSKSRGMRKSMHDELADHDYDSEHDSPTEDEEGEPTLMNFGEG